MKVFLIFLILLGVAFQFLLGFGDYMSDLTRTLNEVSRQTVVTLKVEFPFLSFIGIGGSVSPEGVINHKSLAFQTQKIIDKEEGIRIIARIIDKFIKNLYAEKKMHTYLIEHPFTYKNLNITIFVHDDKDDRVYHPGLHLIDLSEGVFSYETVIPSERFCLETESYIQEPYEEAAKRVGVWPPKDDLSLK